MRYGAEYTMAHMSEWSPHLPPSRRRRVVARRRAVYFERNIGRSVRISDVGSRRVAVRAVVRAACDVGRATGHSGAVWRRSDKLANRDTERMFMHSDRM
jgi:hypothetical protein